MELKKLNKSLQPTDQGAIKLDQESRRIIKALSREQIKMHHHIHVQSG